MECMGRIHMHYGQVSLCKVCKEINRCVNICLETNRSRWDNEEEDV